MRLPDEQDNRMSPQLVAAVVGVGFLVLLILVIVLSMNRKTGGNAQSWQRAQEQAQAARETTLSEQEEFQVGTLRPSDLEFWDLYPPDEAIAAAPEEMPGSTSAGLRQGTGGSGESVSGNGSGSALRIGSGGGSAQGEISGSEEEVNETNDGKHTRIVSRDGSEEWVLISPYLPKNDYEFTNLVSQSDVMKYYVDGRQVSHFGIDISKYNDYIDFNKVRKSGVDFVMIRLGTRGYGTGQITMDDYFADNIKRAADAGLQIGIYFTSQAVTEEEILEEASLCLEAVSGVRIDYPIVLDLGFAVNDTARIEELTRSERTDLAKRFLETVSEAGYTGMIRADKEFLIKELDLSKLTAFDTWLEQAQDLPDYPYQFTMWQYKTNGSIDGVSGNVNFDISFIDYSEK